LAELGLAFSSALFRPLTLGVPGAAVNAGSPAVERLRVGAEVVIEGLVLLEDHHQMLDRGRGRFACRRRGAGVGEGTGDAENGQCQSDQQAAGDDTPALLAGHAF
jgi:hypothetical protein